MTNQPHALYRFFAADGALLYIGISSNPGTRWKQHSTEKPWWTDVATVTMQHFDTRDDVLAAERDAIVAEQPRHNVVYNRRRTVAPAPRPARRRIDTEACADRLERARNGERIPAYLTQVTVARNSGTVSGVVGECPFCGAKHTHGLGRDIERPLLGSRVAHCGGAGASYHLTATLGAFADPSTWPAVTP